MTTLIGEREICTRCGQEDDYLTSVQVVTAQGEEGFADITHLFCQLCLVEVTTTLTELGFKDHRHGGVNFLEDMDCPGWNGCVTPNGGEEDERPWSGTYIPTPPKRSEGEAQGQAEAGA